eukprot:1734313-Amphidinium_carterae.1
MRQTPNSKSSVVSGPLSGLGKESSSSVAWVSLTSELATSRVTDIDPLRFRLRGVSITARSDLARDRLRHRRSPTRVLGIPAERRGPADP